MSREQGPRFTGMRPAANAGSARRDGLGISDMGNEGARMSTRLLATIKEKAV
jgi:hypothetical protein